MCFLPLAEYVIEENSLLLNHRKICRIRSMHYKYWVRILAAISLIGIVIGIFCIGMGSTQNLNQDTQTNLTLLIWIFFPLGGSCLLMLLLTVHEIVITFNQNHDEAQVIDVYLLGIFEITKWKGRLSDISGISNREAGIIQSNGPWGTVSNHPGSLAIHLKNNSTISIDCGIEYYLSTNIKNQLSLWL